MIKHAIAAGLFVFVMSLSLISGLMFVVAGFPVSAYDLFITVTTAFFSGFCATASSAIFFRYFRLKRRKRT